MRLKKAKTNKWINSELASYRGQGAVSHGPLPGSTVQDTRELKGPPVRGMHGQGRPVR